MADSNESSWQAPFTAAALVTAYLMPITIVLVGIVTFLWLITDGESYRLLQEPGVRFYVFILIALSLFHGFHRILNLLSNLGLRNVRGILSVLCYGCALVGTVVALLLVLRVWP